MMKAWIEKTLRVAALFFLACLASFVAASPALAAYFDNDAKADIAVFRPGSGYWFILRSSNGVSEAVQLGVPGDTPVPGDYDGDGKTDIAVYRSSSQYWFIIRSSDGGSQAVQFGIPGDLPVPGDYDGDGKTDIAIYRPAYGYWFILRSSDGATEAAAYGEPTLNDQPVPGDYDGDGKTDIAVYRSVYGYWFVKRSSDGATQAAAYGEPTLNDQPVPGDYDGDGKTDYAVYRGVYGYWFVMRSSDGATQAAAYGEPTLNDQPVPGDYDGDGKTDYAVYRGLYGYWFVLRSSDGASQAVAFGEPSLNDMPLKPAAESSDLGAIRFRMNLLQALVNDNNATPVTLDPFFHTDYLDEGRTKSEELALWSTGEGPQPGGVFSNIRLLSLLSSSPRRHLVSFLYTMPNGKESFSRLVMQRDGGVWRLYGDQRIMALRIESKVVREFPPPPAPPATINGLSLEANDGAGKGGNVQSIVVTGPGLPPAGITMNREGAENFNPQLPSGIYNLPDDGVIGAIPDHALYTFNLYSGPGGTGNILYTYSVENPKRPYLLSEINDSLFPQLISPTIHEMLAAHPNEMLVPIYAKPAGHSADGAQLSFWDGLGTMWNAFDSGNPAAYAFNSAGYGIDIPVAASVQINTVDTTTARVSGINWGFSPGTPVPYSLQLTGASFLFLRDNSNGTKGYWHDVAVRNPDGTMMTEPARIQDVRFFSYPSMALIPPSGPWSLFWSPMDQDFDGNGPNPPTASPYSGIEGYLNVPVGTWPPGFTLCVVTDNTGKQQLTWLYHTAPTEVPKVLSPNMLASTNLDNSVTLSWVPLGSPPLDPAKHIIRVYVNSSIDSSGDGFDDVLFQSNLSWNASSYTIPSTEVARLKGFSSLYWYVQTRENIPSVPIPGGGTRNYFTYRNNGQTKTLTLP